MDIKLIEGKYTYTEALEIIIQMIHIKIRFHENKITGLCTEEDIKFREKRIKQLQRDLYDVEKFIKSKQGNISLKAIVQIQ